MADEWCLVNNCGKKASVVFLTYRSLKIARCAGHYMENVDRMGLGATSKKFMARLKLDRENREILGHREYDRKAFDLLRRAIHSYGSRR